MRKVSLALIILVYVLALTLAPFQCALADTALNTELVINGGAEAGAVTEHPNWIDEGSPSHWSSSETYSDWPPASQGSRYFFLYNPDHPASLVQLSSSMSQTISLSGTEGTGLFASIAAGNVALDFSVDMYQKILADNNVQTKVEEYSASDSLLATYSVACTTANSGSFSTFNINTQLNAGTRKIKITLIATLTKGGYAEYDAISLQLVDASTGSAPVFGSDFPTEGAINASTTYTHGFTITDADAGDIDHLTFSASSTNINLVPAANVTVSGSGTSRTLTITPTASLSGEADITLTASDGSKSATATIHLVVSKVINLGTNLVENGNATSGFASWSGSNTNVTASGNGFVIISPEYGMYQKLDISKFSSVIDAGMADYEFKASEILGGSGQITLQFYSDIACTTALGSTLVNTNNSTRTGVIPANAKGAIVTFSSQDTSYRQITIRNISFVILNNFPKMKAIDAQNTKLVSVTVPVYAYYMTASATLTATSSDQTVVSNGGIVAGGSGFARSLTFTPLKQGTADITATINDGSSTASRTFTVTVHEPATITGFTMPTAGYYGAGGNLDFTVNFSRDIQGGSASTLPLTIGGYDATASYLSATANSITYRYTVGSSDEGAVALGSAIDDTASNITDTEDYDAELDFTAGATGITVIPTPSVTGTATGDTAVYGTQVTFTMSLTCADTLTGTVQFYADAVAIGSPVTLSGNQASYQTAATTLDAGTPAISAIFTPSGASCHFTSLYSSAYSLTVTPKSVTVTGLTATNRPYDGTSAVTLSGGSLTGVLTGDSVSGTYPTSGTAASANKGTQAVSFNAVTLAGDDKDNYAISAQPTVSVTISAKPISYTAVVADKEYDGTTDGTVSSLTFDGVVTGETLASGVDYTATVVFDSASIAENVPATVTVTLLSTTKAANYTLSAATYGTTADITRKLLTVTGVTAANRNYNGGTAVTLSGGTLVGVESGDIGHIGFTLGDGTIADANAGTAKAVTTSIVLTGDAADDYSLTQPSDVTVDIGKVSLTLDNAAASDKAYDGNATATVTDASVSGEIAGENLVFGTDYTATGLFSDANVGEDKAVTVTVTLVATALAGNYSLPANTVGATASITNSGVTITGVSATNRAYNGTASVALTGGTLVGIAAEDVGNIGFTLNAGTMEDANVGDGKAVSTSIVLTGTKAGNYTLTQPSGITVDIAKAALTVTGATVSDKDYDGNSDATVTDVTFGGLAAGEALAINVDYTATGAFPSANIASDAAVTINVTLNSTALANNYTVSGPGTAAASIGRLDLSGAVTIDVTNGAGNASLIDEGDVLSVNTGSITLPGALTAKYQWYRNGTEIAGEAGTSHTVGDLTADPVGTEFTVTVEGTGNYQGTLTSDAVTVIQITIGGSVSITGDTARGDVLTLHTTAVTPSGASFHISWQREGADIAGASDVSYTITKTDQDKTLTATVTGYGYFTGSLNASIDIPPSPYVPDAGFVDLTSMVTVDLTMGSTLLSEEQMDMLLTLNAAKPVVFGGDGYTITFPAGTMHPWTGDLNLGVHFNTGTGYAAIVGSTGSTLVLMFEFIHSGALPGEAQITIDIGINYAGQTLRYLYYNPLTGKVELLDTVPVDAEGRVTVTQDHCSSYALARFSREGVPQTGDNTPLALWWSLAGLCTVGLLTLLFWYFKKKRT